jgi:hypothetical protein
MWRAHLESSFGELIWRALFEAPFNELIFLLTYNLTK